MLSLFSYALVIGICLIFTFYMDGEVGVLMLSFMALIPVFSLVLMLVARFTVSLHLEIAQLLRKGKPVQVTVTFTKKTPLPTPFLRYYLRGDAHFQASDLETHMMLGPERRYESTHFLQPAISGRAEVYVDALKLTGYLGFLRLSMPKSFKTTTIILPDVPELQAGTVLFQSVCSAVMTDSDDESAVAQIGVHTTAGYEHRTYIPGDPLKRINWKLSSKRHELMVRMDEAVAVSKITVVLDMESNPVLADPRIRFLFEERITEGALGLLSLFAKNGLSAWFHRPTESGWSMEMIDSDECTQFAAIHVFDRGFCEQGLERVPPDLGGNGVLIVFTTCPDAALYTALQCWNGERHVIMPEEISVAREAGCQFWRISPTYEISPIEG